MALYVAPNSTIHILKGVYLDNTYQHTIYFDDKTKQRDYFISKKFITLENYTFQRERRDVINVEIPSDRLYDCTYLMFQNTAYSNKWFYAFILSVEYVNNNTSRITYEIDELQTWFLDIIFHNSFVEREMVMSDEIGEHTVDEGIPITNYVSNSTQWRTFDFPYHLLIVTTFKMDEELAIYEDEIPQTIFFQGVFMQFQICIFRMANDADCEYIKHLFQYINDKGLSDGVVCAYEFPHELVSAMELDSERFGYDINAYVKLHPKKIKNPEILGHFYINTNVMDGYRPKNNKMWTAPFTIFSISNMQGQVQNYYPQQFTSGTFADGRLTYRIRGVLYEPSLTMSVTGYEKADYSDDKNVSITNFPQPLFVSQIFKEYLAQHQNTLALNAISSAINTGLAVAMPLSGGSNNVLTRQAISKGGTLIDSVLNGLSPISQIMDMSNKPAVSHGQPSNYYGFMYNQLGFRFQQYCPIADVAKNIDDYFSMFGYKVNAIKIPNRNGRKEWNYVKTKGLNITGNIPAIAKDKIIQIHDNGITYWNKGDNIGRYYLDNTL